MLPRKPVNKKIDIFYGVQFAVSLVSLNDCRSQNSDRIKKFVIKIKIKSSRGLFSLRRSHSPSLAFPICYE